jgi:type VI secretion system protein
MTANRVYGGRITLLALVLAGSGCFPKKLLSPRYTMAVNVAADCNANSPIAFDVVEVNDKDLAKQVAQMTAADWFQKRDQIVRDFPKPKSVSLMKWEWVPGEVVPDIEIPMRKAPRLLVAFANYAAAGPHRVKLDPKKQVLVTLARDDLEISPLPKK